MGCRSEVFLSKKGLRETKIDGRKYNARHKDGLKRNIVCPNAVSGIDYRVTVIHASQAKAYPWCHIS